MTLSLGECTFPGERMIFLAASDDSDDKPLLNGNCASESENNVGMRTLDGEACLSSVVTYGVCDGEPETVMTRPVVITFEHCASLFPKDNWHFALYADVGAGWEVATVVGEENMNTVSAVESDLRTIT